MQAAWTDCVYCCNMIHVLQRYGLLHFWYARSHDACGYYFSSLFFYVSKMSKISTPPWRGNSARTWKKVSAGFSRACPILKNIPPRSIVGQTHRVCRALESSSSNVQLPSIYFQSTLDTSPLIISHYELPKITCSAFVSARLHQRQCAAIKYPFWYDSNYADFLENFLVLQELSYRLWFCMFMHSHAVSHALITLLDHHMKKALPLSQRKRLEWN